MSGLELPSLISMEDPLTTTIEELFNQEMLADPLGQLQLLDEHDEAVIEESLSNILALFDDFHQETVVSTAIASVEPERQHQEEMGLYLINLLLGCADAIEKENYKLGRSILSRLTAMASPMGDAMQRIAVYFGKALQERVDNDLSVTTTYVNTRGAASQPMSTGEINSLFHVAYQTFYQLFPYGKFVHFTANQAILEAVGGDKRIHVVDLDIGQGLQWPSFIQSLALRDSKPFHLKITGVGSDPDTLQQTGRRLCEFAASLEVQLEYHAVEEIYLQNLDARVLRVHLGESLAVNCPHVLSRSLGSQHGILQSVMRMLQKLKPIVVAVVEVESNNNLPSFLNRFVEALHHYSGLFDCLEATLGKSSKERLLIEEFHFAPNLRNILAAERSNRMVRHVRTEDWQDHFRRVGFRDLPLSGYTLYQAKLLLGLYDGAYKLTGQSAALNLGWLETPIVTVSTWTS